MSLRGIVRRRLLWLGGVIMLVGMLLPNTAAAQSPSPLDPASPNAALIANLYWIVFWMSVAVFILVEGLLIYSAIRFRRRSDDELPVQVYGNNRMEIAWTIGPALIAIAVFVLAWQVMLADRPPTAAGLSPVSVASVCFNNDVTPEEAAAFLAASTLTIEIVGQQWWWQYNYLDYNFTTAADLYVPVGDVVVLQITSRDVAHAWWIPQLGGKQDLYPGAVTFTWFQVSRPGVFEGNCTELCGSSHAYMPMRVIALPPDEFDAWAQAQVAKNQVNTIAIANSSTQVQRGEQVFVKKGCVGCHAVGGLGVNAQAGPNLSNFASRRQIAGIMPNTEDNLRSWIANPSQKPGARMPAIPIAPDEMDALIAYLGTLK